MLSKTVFPCVVSALLLAGCTTLDRGRRPRRYRPLYEVDISVQDRLPEKDRPPRPPVQPPPASPKPQPPPAPPVQPPPEQPKQQPPAPPPPPAQPDERQTPPAPPSQGLPAAEVERLRTLLNLGFITKEEFEQKMSGQNAK